MGLDNGIIMKADNLTKEQMDQICPYYDSSDDYHVEGFTIGYWRKCWGIRNAILHVLDPMNKKGDNIEYPIECKDIPAIIKELLPFLSRDYWEEEANSIWEYNEMFYKQYHILIRLEWLRGYMKEHPEVTCYFYDSY